MQHRADIDLPDVSDDTIVYQVLSQEVWKSSVKLLIQHGVDVSKINQAGSTVLYLALQQGTRPVIRTLEEDISFVQFLTTHGADILARNNDGDAPVHNLVGAAQYRTIRED